MKKDETGNEMQVKPRQKRARKASAVVVDASKVETVQNQNIQIVIEDDVVDSPSVNLSVPLPNAVLSVPLPVPLPNAVLSVPLPVPLPNASASSQADLRKRGRKPKGGKVVIRTVDTTEPTVAVTNVILHLKCSLKDLNEYNQEQSKMMTNPLNYNAEVPPNIMTYNGVSKGAFSTYDTENHQKLAQETSLAYSDGSTFLMTNGQKDAPNNQLSSANITSVPSVDTPKEDGAFDICKDDPSVSMKDIHAKLKRLKISLYKNSLHEKKSSCFWCTYDFDNQACYIPKYEMDGEICAYGSFCRPECAVAYLMKEGVDDSTKFERYHLLNQLYGKIYQFKENIKPAPNPYYLLDKFYGNLTIQEYRKLLNTEHMLLVIDKPLTRILPELHEDTDDFIVGIYGGNKGASTQAGGVYKVKRQSEKQQGPSKSSIIRGKFGLTQ